MVIPKYGKSARETNWEAGGSPDLFQLVPELQLSDGILPAAASIGPGRVRAGPPRL